MVEWYFHLTDVFPEIIEIILIRNQRKLEGGKEGGRNEGVQEKEGKRGQGGRRKRGHKEMYHL